MSSKNKRQVKSDVVINQEVPSSTDNNSEIEAQLRSVIQSTAVVVSIVCSPVEATVVIALAENDALLAIPNIETAIGQIGWKLEDWSVEEGKTTLVLAAAVSDDKPPVEGWWDGQSFRGDVPEILLQDIMPFLPDHGRVDLNVMANAAGCSFLHIDKLLTRALSVDAIPGLRKVDRTWWIGEPLPEAKTQAPSAEVLVDPAHLAQVEALKAAIEQLSPEAKAKAIEMGIVAGQRRTVKASDPVGSGNKTPRTAKVREQHECACGCGGLTYSAFCMGHDARAKGRLQRAVNGKLLQNELDWRPNTNLIAYVRSHPEWDTKFGVWLRDYEHAVEELGGEDEVILDTDDGNENNEE